ncbi:MAG: methylaspartate mutase accessory protein GlmL [Peptoniphilaceae bacterium]|nr:methylaspartate mutase accessory protein GlmL [Peptoniphilaceae bacterium]MDY6086184.1 methylaspartate mutase accessory protein GlmL [Peptoniphilaceae bacterium]
MRILLVDIGSTFTKGTLVDTTPPTLLARGQSKTTIDTGVMHGVNAMLDALEADGVARGFLSPSATRPFWDEARVCSSAAGGLKMVAVGLAKRLTAEAATRAALGAGARILRTFSGSLTAKDLEAITALNPDMLLLSGGTDGGNRVNLVQNARALATLPLRIPIVISGNSAVAPEAAAILSDFDATIVDNVMPQVNVLNAQPARAAIRDLFMRRITHAKGLDDVVRIIGPVVMPTPDAVLEAMKLLARGTAQTSGIGDLILADVGGATTDIHSIGRGNDDRTTITIDGKRSELRYEGLAEPWAKRTVEGDLGMRYSAQSLLESVGEDALNALYPADYPAEMEKRTQDTTFVPQTDAERAVDTAMARACVQTALGRHMGTLRRDYEIGGNLPGRSVYYLSGKDLTDFPTLIGTGGVLVHNAHPERILAPEPELLYPAHPALYVDREYILSAMGLLSAIDPEAALTLTKTSLGLS